MVDAFKYWEIDLTKRGKEVIPATEVAIYTGTTMVNTLLTRRGAKVGCLVTKGFEDSFTLERGFQKIAGYSYSDRLHSVTHMANEPLVPKHQMKGITERTDVFGKEAIPLYENEVRQAVEELINEGVQAIAVTFLFSYLNPSHEQEAARIAHSVIEKLGREVPVFISSEVCPIIRELPRLNSTVLHAYTGEPVRKQLFQIEAKLKENNLKPSLQTFLSYGGLADIRYPRLYESMISGPAGGLCGANFIGQIIGESNIITGDLGGTSFDVGIISAGIMPIQRESEFARFILNLPMVVVDSVGAGVGTYIRIDPITNRIILGPGSAGGDPGPVAYDKGNETPTIADCDLLVGILNPDYYLGGSVKLNKEKSLRIFKEKIADRLKLDVYEAAEGIIKLNDYTMAEILRASLLSRGHSPSDYVLAVYGGAGPMHMASFGFPAEMSFKGVVTFPFAAAFSAFGCATVDFSRRYHKSTTIVSPPGANEDSKATCASKISQAWKELEKEAVAAMIHDGYKEKDIVLERSAFIRYGGQLDDLEVRSPLPRLQTAEDFDALIARFENLYSKVYALGAKFPAGGFQILEVAVTASVYKVKPKIEVFTKEGKTPKSNALKETRKVYHNQKWGLAKIYEMEKLSAGNEIEGLAIIEAPNTTLFIPEGRKIRLDERRFIWME